MLTGTLVIHHASAQRFVEQASSSGSIESFLQYGVLGLVVVGFITGWIVPGYQAKALVAENARLTALFENRALPLIEQSSSALDRAAKAMEASTAMQQRMAEDAAAERARRDRAGQ